MTRPSLLAAARELFYEQGVAVSGVDELVERAGLTKPTFYRHFSSKDSVVEAYLDERNEQLDAELNAWLERARPEDRPRVVIDWVCDWIRRPDFNGCSFVRTVAELHGNRGVLTRARTRKHRLQEAIERACREAGFRRPRALAEELFLVVEGATTAAFLAEDRAGIAATTKRLGQTVIQAAARVRA